MGTMTVGRSKQLRRLRTTLGLGAMVGLPALLALVFWLGRGQAPERGAPQDIFALATQSGLNFAAASLEAMGRFFLVVVVALFAGEPVAGEANWGTLRYLLVRPVSRPKLLRDKLVIAMLLGTVAIALVPLAGMAAGTVAFGWGRLQIPFGSLGTGPALTKLAIGTAYEAISLSAIAALAFMLSTTTSSPAGPVAVGVGAAIVSQILDAIPSLGNVAKWLPTHYWGAWTQVLARPPQTSGMLRGVLGQVPYVVVFLALAWSWFQRKDILS
ncbi:MAG: ABC transporter permease [Actinomycetota bacterium]